MNNDNHPKITLFLIFAIFAIMPIVFSPSAFAETDENTPIQGQYWLVVEDNNKCTDKKIQTLKLYESISKRYFEKYGEYIQFNEKPKCVLIDELKDFFEEFDLQVMQADLSIIVTDSENNLQILKKFYDGVENHESNHFVTSPIVLCACSLPAESYSTAWQISHEFSHFVLKYKGESENVYIDWVHEAESKVEHCLVKTHRIYNCPDLWAYIKSDSGKIMFMLPVHPDYNREDYLK